jgi:hypothetical protein
MDVFIVPRICEAQFFTMGQGPPREPLGLSWRREIVSMPLSEIQRLWIGGPFHFATEELTYGMQSSHQVFRKAMVLWLVNSTGPFLIYEFGQLHHTEELIAELTRRGVRVEISNKS